MTDIKITDGAEPFDCDKSAEDVISCIRDLEQENERLRAGINQAVAALWSWIYSRKSRRIIDIYDDLKALLNAGGGDG